ncbi:TM2 domain-containing protein [Winogradskyella luteola]|uniref:NINE protein n=1 Tax=Winogradskyella luteola TaxID=2828330 RepID=A0A9X1JQK8_9FLAO|nr:TM2 domain-containing protein [Winogradskyella luteola]MBV7269003.1 NINE protein [Winogradskyella luteola]
MADDNKDLGDDLNDMLDDAKEGAKRTGDKISQKASELADDAEELGRKAKAKASEFADEAKETAKEFSDSAKEAYQEATGDNKKVLAGILGIIFGSLGIHKFILGYNKEGGIMLGITLIGIVLSCVGIGVFLVWIMSIIGLIEGIIYLTKSDAEFYNMYQVGKKPWF